MDDMETGDQETAGGDALAIAMNDRRVELSLTWTDVAKRAGDMSTQNLTRIRKGTINITDLAAGRVEKALGWPPGRVRELRPRGVARSENPQHEVAEESQDLFVRELLDEVEEDIWSVEDASDDARWAAIFRRRKRRAKQVRAASPMRRSGT